MTKYKVSELEGDLLSQALALYMGNGSQESASFIYSCLWNDENEAENWGTMGPLIEMEGVSIYPEFDEKLVPKWYSLSKHRPRIKAATACGDTPLIAAARCLISSKFGDEVEL